MKILQINASYKPATIYGGPTMSVSQLSERLVLAGVIVDVFTTTANGMTELDVLTHKAVNIDGVSVFYFSRITRDHSHFSPRLLIKLWNVVRQYDVVHIHAWWNLVSVFSALIAHIRRVPVLISPRGTLSAYSFRNNNVFLKNAIHQSFGKELLTKSYIHTTSLAECKAVRDIIEPKNVFNIPNFVKLTTENITSVSKKAGLFEIFFLSRIEQKKGLDLLLKALSLINYPYHLTIAGDGSKDYIEQLKRIASEHSVANHISWIGFQEKDKFTLLSRHDLLVLPSHDENFGNVIIESLAMGTPVLISKYVGLSDYVEKNGLGWLCDTNISSVGTAINDIIANRGDDLVRIRTNAPARIAEDFNENKLIHEYITAYQSIIEHE